MSNAREVDVPPPLNDVLTRLEGVRHDGALQFSARCPAHDDKEPSLSVSWGNGKVVLHDHAGCTNEAILRALNLKWSDLEQPLTLEITHDYEDAEGDIVYQVLKYQPKTFRVRQPHPTHPGEFIWNLKGVDPLPFGLEYLVAALAAGEDVYITEGETDSLALRAAYEVTATTNHGGAGKWTDEFHSVWFKGSPSRVTIIADRDKTGYKGALKTHDSLLRVAGIDAQIVLPAFGKDARDHVGDHALSAFVPISVEDMKALSDSNDSDDTDHDAKVAEQVEWLKVNREARAIASAEGWEPPPVFGTLQEQLSNEREAVVWLIESLAFVGANVLINAAAKSGKTVLILNVIRALLNGDSLFGHFGVERLTEGSVVWWNAELTPNQAIGWLEQMDFPEATRFYPEHLRGFSIPLDTPAGEDWAVARLKAQKCKVWVLDPKSALFTGEENSATETGAWLSALDRIKRRAGVETLFLVHHASEASDMDTPDDKALRLVRGRGSTRMEGWADVLWSYTGRFDEPRYLSALGRDVDVAPFGGIHMTSATKALRWNGNTTTPSADRRYTRMLEAVDALAAADGPLKAGDLQRKMSGAKPDPKREAIDYAVDLGYIRRWEGPSNSTLHELGEKSPRVIQMSFTSEENDTESGPEKGQ